jgi:CheY-like chemotaxis protein
MQTYRILIVDDDDTHREVLGDYLQRADLPW